VLLLTRGEDDCEVRQYGIPDICYATGGTSFWVLQR